MPGTSLNKFLETLETLFEGFRPFKPINKIHFQNASRHYETLMHLIDNKIKLRDKTLCFSCKGIMLASHPDGNFKLYRLRSALGLNLTSLYGNAVIAYDEDIEKHKSLIDSKIFKVHPGFFLHRYNNVLFFRASQVKLVVIQFSRQQDPTQEKYKKLDETGIMMRTCRHGIVDKAVNMHQGETFRHTHFIHVDLPEKKCSFLCGDVMCRYWKWAQKVALLFPEFQPMIKDMKPFLGRMHAKVHVWYCQILWVGHWMLDAALTLGEEQEQVFSKMSRYGSVTKHMGGANRRDHITAAVFSGMRKRKTEWFINLLKEGKEFLVSSLKVILKHTI
ncbi:uncharacterized protein LOC123467411 isoform X3 [Daphnia magna]|uniref:uncharacterized protein LOC123467411 isoform X3 n=1 Tax=Daphnia magna TaxID=35525 RepID=UPI001E1BAEE8|nr:uncharacterized protein LOC123467411 isoform X3 [Daphnia magna]